VLEITYGNLSFIAASIYLDIRNEISSELHRLEDIQRLANTRGLLVAIDSNVRSTTWTDAKAHKRGGILDEYLLSNQLNIANKESAFITFEFTRGTSNVDLTVADNKMMKLMHTCSAVIKKVSPTTDK
jgi:hypothetical protein